MSFQKIIDYQTSMKIDSRKLIQRQRSRSGIVKTVEYPTANPFTITVSPSPTMSYVKNRSLIQSINNSDRVTSQRVTFTDNGYSKLAHFVEYQGGMSAAQLAGLTYNSASGSTVKLNLTVAVPSGTTIFKAGDFIQLPRSSGASTVTGGSYVYNVASDVISTGGSAVDVKLHRLIIGSPFSGGAVKVGTACQWDLLADSVPNYSLQPYADSDSFIVWDGDFTFIENIEG